MLRLLVLFCIAAAAFASAVPQPVSAQQLNKSYNVGPGARIEIVNHFGRVEVITPKHSGAESEEAAAGSGGQVVVSAASPSGLEPKEIEITASRDSIRISVSPVGDEKRVDISVSIPPRTRLKLETIEGEILISGDIAEADARTETGTIAADVPTENIKYSLLWTASRPRFLSDFELEKVKERSAGKFEISGRYRDEDTVAKRTAAQNREIGSDESMTAANGSFTNSDPSGRTLENDTNSRTEEKGKRKKERLRAVDLSFRTARGIVLLNVPPNEVTSDLRERPLTNAAKAIIKSGDSLLMEAIRRAAPKYYGDYMRTLPPLKLEPTLGERSSAQNSGESSVKVAMVRVSDANNKTVGDLSAADFEVLESGKPRDVISVNRSSAPFNLVLLLDVSGSVENYVNFIRKAARSFVNTVDARDKVSIVTFADDVNLLSRFTTDKHLLSESLDTFDAGGATAYYDALAYTLADTLRPLKGERTAIVILTDGDDNRSFLPFDSMLSAVQESGVLIYPLYVPSALIAASESAPNASIDTLRRRYLQGELSSKAKGEGERLAHVSGGVYYEISQLSQINAAYEQIVQQLRSAYEVEYRSQLGGADTGVSPRLRIRTKRPSTYVQIRSVEQRTVAKPVN